MDLLEYGLYQAYKNLGLTDSAYDSNENETHITVSIGIPGLTIDDIEILIRDGKRLLVKSKRSSKFTPNFSYVFGIPTKIIKEDTYATVKDGILTVYLKKDEEKDFKIKLK